MTAGAVQAVRSRADLGDLARVRLVARVPCDGCSATGKAVTADWEGYYAWASRRLDGPLEPTTEPRARELEQVRVYFIDTCGLAEVPPIGEPCVECGGAGWIDSEIPLQILGETLAALMRPPVLAAGEINPAVERLKATMLGAVHTAQTWGAQLADPDQVASMLRVVQEAAEALRAIDALRPEPADSGGS